jgi:hypothetical protein
VQSAEQNCEWVEQGIANLPEFPTLGEFEFTLPPIPRLLPTWERLQSLSTETRIASGDAAHEASTIAQALAMGAAAGAGAFALVASLVALAKHTKKRRAETSGQAGRLSLRAGASKTAAVSS